MSGDRGLTVLFYPSFDNSEEFTDHYYRMMWYLHPLREIIERIVMPHEEEPPSLGAFPYYLDPTIQQMADGSGIADVVDLLSSKHTGLLENAAREADVVLVWRVGSGQGNRVPDGPVKPVVMRKKRYFVDHKHERYAGSHYLMLSAQMCSNDATVKECTEKFKRIPATGFSRTGYIYGTGPSLQDALEMNLSDGTSIICNTIVKNRELMRKLKPAVIAVADPIFHAGCSSYAGEFRRHLLQAMCEFENCYLIVPMRDYYLYMANLQSSLRPRIIGLPFVAGDVPNLNLYKNFYVTATPNILTLFLIPLAATFFQKTFILGCDGRPLDQDDYFWEHDSSSQLTEHMNDIQVAHPAFFNINYNDYYLEHCQVLARWLSEADRQRKPFLSLTPSHIPALSCRQPSGSAVRARLPAGPVETQVHIINLNPDLSDSLGHPLAYDTQLCFACAQRGVEFISAANARIDPDLLQSYPYLRAVFRDRSSVLGRVTGYAEPPAPAVERFHREVEDFVDKYLTTCKPADEVILYLYTGGLVHVEALYDIVKARPQVSAHINLFWCSWMRICDEDFSDRWAETLRKVVLEETLVLTVPTIEMQREIQEAAGVVLPVAPMPSTTFADAEAKNALEHGELRALGNVETAAFSVLFPSLMRKPKGYDLSIAVIRLLGKKQTDAFYQCTLRYVPIEGTPSKLIRSARGAREFANIVEGILPPEEFQRMLKGADIIVLPYQPSEFSNRTSGLLIDALLCGVPLVVQRGTWLGNLVARYDCGALAETASPKAYIKAIESVAANHHHYKRNAISAGKKWLADNSWATLLEFVLESPPPLAASEAAIPARLQQNRRNILAEVARPAATRMRRLSPRALYWRLVGYLMINYPTIITIGRFGKWSLSKLRKTLFGIGGIFLLVIAGLYIAGALIEPLRWYLVGTASALLLLGGGLLTLSYVRVLLDDFLSSQRRAMGTTLGGTNPDFAVVLHRQLDERKRQARWRTIKNLYKGQRAFIIGNGPSLNRTPLHLLKDEFTLCFNRFDLMFERLAWRPTMYMCVDDRVAESSASKINEIVTLVDYAFFPDIHPYGLDFQRFIEDAHNVYWLSLKSISSPGSYETLPTCSTIGTVAHLGLQVLAFMGFSPIYLVGVDLDYKKHKTVIKHDQGNWTATRDDDPSHFDPRYFGAGAKYHEPSPYYVLISGFPTAKQLLDKKGIRVLNASVGGSLEVFPRVDFRSLFDFDEDIELEMLLSGISPALQPDARVALRADGVIKAQDDWDERSPLQVTTLPLAEQLIPKVIFTHVPYGPFGNRCLFIRRDNV